MRFKSVLVQTVLLAVLALFVSAPSQAAVAPASNGVEMAQGVGGLGDLQGLVETSAGFEPIKVATYGHWRYWRHSWHRPRHRHWHRPRWKRCFYYWKKKKRRHGDDDDDDDDDDHAWNDDDRWGGKSNKYQAHYKLRRHYGYGSGHRYGGYGYYGRYRGHDRYSRYRRYVGYRGHGYFGNHYRWKRYKWRRYYHGRPWWKRCPISK